MILVANAITVYSQRAAGFVSNIKFAGAWTSGESCDPSKESGAAIAFSGAWTSGENCDPNKISGITIAFSGAWTTGENCI